MQIKLNKKNKTINFIQKQGRQEHIVAYVYEPINITSLQALYKSIEKINAEFVIIPQAYAVFSKGQEPEPDDFAYYTGKFIKNNKVAILTQGHYSLGNLEVHTFGKNNEFTHIITDKLRISVISPLLGPQEFKSDMLPDIFDATQIMIANYMLASSVLSLDYPVYIFWGDKTGFEKNTGITNFETRESITINKVESSIIDSATIYFMEV